MRDNFSPSLKSFFDFITSLLSNFIPEDISAYVTSLLIVTSIAILFLLVYIFIIKPIVNIFRNYIKARKKHAKFRIEDPSGFSWGNSLLRVPLLAIGTDIFAFAKSSVKSKTVRYIKAVSVFIPVFWCIFSLVLLLSRSKTEFENIDIYILGLPVLLIGVAIYILDLSIIINKNNNKAKIIRIIIAIITGYLFSSIPLDYIYKSDIESYLTSNDDQLEEIKIKAEKEKSKILNSQSYIEYKKLKITLEKDRKNISNQLILERDGLGATGKRNSSDPRKNGTYNQIESEYIKLNDQYKDLIDTNKFDVERLNEIDKTLRKDIDKIQSTNVSNHIKRHLALWSYALSSLGAALFFFCCVVLFWLVDTLAVITSFLDESEYDKNVEEHNRHRENVFQKKDFEDAFSPMVANDTL